LEKSPITPPTTIKRAASVSGLYALLLNNNIYYTGFGNANQASFYQRSNRVLRLVAVSQSILLLYAIGLTKSSKNLFILIL
jgi:hypothetical protein